jgi:hypothetical protein
VEDENSEIDEPTCGDCLSCEETEYDNGIPGRCTLDDKAVDFSDEACGCFEPV